MIVYSKGFNPTLVVSTNTRSSCFFLWLTFHFYFNFQARYWYYTGYILGTSPEKSYVRVAPLGGELNMEVADCSSFTIVHLCLLPVFPMTGRQGRMDAGMGFLLPLNLWKLCSLESKYDYFLVMSQHFGCVDVVSGVCVVRLESKYDSFVVKFQHFGCIHEVCVVGFCIVFKCHSWVSSSFFFFFLKGHSKSFA